MVAETRGYGAAPTASRGPVALQCGQQSILRCLLRSPHTGHVCDAMAHIAQLPSLLYLAYVQHQMTIDEGSKWVRDELQRSWNKLCPEAQEIMREQYHSALKVLP